MLPLSGLRTDKGEQLTGYNSYLCNIYYPSEVILFFTITLPFVNWTSPHPHPHPAPAPPPPAPPPPPPKMPITVPNLQPNQLPLQFASHW